MKKIVALAALRAELTGILFAQRTDPTTSIAYAGMPDNELTSNVMKLLTQQVLQL